MKRFFMILPALCILLLTACGPSHTPGESTAPPATGQSVGTTVPPQSSVAETEATISQDHSWLYIPGLSVEDVILYFNEVCLDAEYANSGDPSKLQKWMTPIYYIRTGLYTNEDLKTLASFTEFLNTIDGFPGIYEAENTDQANLEICFCTQADMVDRMGDQYLGADGGVIFWYSDNEIYDATICCSTEAEQMVRNSVILEEIYNGLGPVQDTSLRTDSIIYAGYSEPQSLTEIDELLLILLYHPKMECGMDAAACEAVIRELYY